MYERIIIALSLEHGIAQQALKAAKALANENAEIVAVHVREPLQGSVRFHIADADLEKVKVRTEKELQERVKGHEGVRAVVLEGHAGQALSDYAATIGADCIVVGSHKPGLRDFFLGSTAARIVRHAPCAVHVMRDEQSAAS